MSTSWFGNMRAPRLKAPLLLLLLLTTLTGIVFCQEKETEDPAEQQSGTDEQEPEDTEAPAVPDVTSAPDTSQTPASETPAPSPEVNLDRGSSGDGPNATEPSREDEGLDSLIIIIPVALVVLIIGVIVGCIFIKCRWNKKRHPEMNKEDPCLDGSSTEKVPMPMFEEDVPSVLELEMEELDEWMKKDSDAPENFKNP